MFKLSATLVGHSQDVRALVSPYNDTIISASRDGTVKVWSLDNGIWTPRDNFTSSSFINSVAFDQENELVVSGGQEKLINITDLYNLGADPKYVLIGHDSNVCCLDVQGTEIISGSWDSTAKVWENYELKYTLEGHNASVWDVKILGDGKYLTSSADGTVKLWKGNIAVKTILGHKDVVRGLALLPENAGFASTSNDGTVRLTTFEGELIQALVGHDSFVYSVKVLSNGDIVTSGEDRTVRVWRDGNAIQVITLPCVSVWTISVLPNDDIVTGGSDSVVRVFTRSELRFASDDELSEFKKAVESISLSNQQFDDSQSKDPSVLTQPGTKEGQVVVVKSAVGINEAHQWSEGKWQKIGEVVSGASSSDRKVEYEGQKYDYVFDVDIKDGVPPLKLPYNVNENPYNAAQRFLANNELSETYLDEVVKFITDNTQGVSITQDISNPYVESRNKVLPQIEYIGFVSDNGGSIFKGISKFNNSEESKFSDAQLQELEKALDSKDVVKLSSTAEFITNNWTNKLPAFDLLRLIAPKLSIPPNSLGDIIKLGLSSHTTTPILFMTLRFLSNIFLNKSWGERLITDSTISNRILSLFASELRVVEEKHEANVANAIATLLLNFSVYCVKFKSLVLAQKIGEVLAQNGVAVSGGSSEAAYRVSVAYGNLIYLVPEVKFGVEFNRFKKFTLGVYKEQRFADIFREINES